MQQPPVREMSLYADIGEVRMETRAATCNQLLAEGWVLLGIYPLTTLREMAEGRSRGEPEQKQPQDTQRYVRRLVGYLGQPSRELYLEGIFTAKTGGVEDLLLPGYCCSLEVLGKEFQGPGPGRLCRLLMVPGASEAAVRLRRNCHGQPMEDTDGTTHVIHFPGWFTHPDESQ